MKWVLYIVILPIFITAAIAGLSAAPWLPTKKKQRQALIDSIPFQKDAVCYDLGCGDGTVLFAISRKEPTVKTIGYDISLLPWLLGNLRKLSHPNLYKNVSIRYGNLFRAPLNDADYVFVFLLNKAYPKLISKFKQELSDETTVIVEAWPLPDIEPYDIQKKEHLLPVYFYKGSQFR